MLKNFTVSLFVLCLVTVPVLTQAQPKVIDYTPNDICEPGKLCNPIKQNSLDGFLKVLVEGVIQIGMPIVALAIIYCGFLFVSARGNPEALTKAKDALLYTLLGAAILLGAWALALAIQTTVKAL
jgi:hypothetical protein